MRRLNPNEPLHSQEDEDLQKPPKVPMVETPVNWKKQKSSPSLLTPPMRKSERISKNRVPEASIPIITPEVSKTKKDPSLGEKLPQIEVSKTQNLPLEAECSINYVFIISDKESNQQVHFLLKCIEV